MKDVSVIIVSYNTKEILSTCLDSMAPFLAPFDHEILIIDNASGDGTAEHLRRHFPAVTLFENAENAGFAKAVNTGLRNAQGRLCALINSDIIFKENVFEKVLKAFGKDEKIGIAGCRLLNNDGSLQKSAYWSYPGILQEIIEYGGLSDGLGRRLGIRYSLNAEEHDEDQEVAHLKGACLFLRRDVVRQVGFLDERFFMYREETDYCKRVHDAGWKVFFLASASLVHLHKVSSEKLADKGVRYRLKSHYQYLLKHRGKIEASLLYVIILFASGARCLLEWVRGGNSRYYAEIVKWHLGLRRL